MNKAIFYASVGGVLEFYDFIVFAIFAAPISAVFFPEVSQVSGLLLTFTVFSAGYLARPLGGLIYGHFGDRYGRKKTFVYSIILMASSTFLMALLPTYAQLGVLAPLLLTLLRLIQGLSIGGEIPGAITFIVETVPARRTLACSLVFFGLVFGIILGGFVHWGLTELMSSSNLLTYGWRIAFGLGGVFGLWGIYLRRKLVETPLFAQVEQAKVKVPAWVVIRDHPLELISGWALMGLVSSGIMTLFLMMPAYSSVVVLPSYVLHWADTGILFIVMMGCVALGYLGDRMSKRLLLLAAAIITLLFSSWFFRGLIAHTLTPWMYALYSMLTFGMATAVVPSVLAESFPTAIRYTGVGMVYNISFATTGGLAPIIVFHWIGITHNPLVPAWYLMGAAACALLGLVIYPRNHFESDVIA